MKLLFIVKTLALAGGGAERVLADVSAGLATRGHDVSVASFDAPAAADFYCFHPSVKRFRLAGSPHDANRARHTIDRIAAVRRHVRSDPPDLAIGFMHSAYIPAAVALAGLRVPVLASEHTVYTHYDTRPAQRFLLHAATHIVQAMTVVSESARRTFPPSIRRKMVLVPNPVRLSSTRRADVAGGERKTLLTVGRLSEEKGHATLVRAFASLAPRFPDWDLRIVGDGPLRSRLETLVRELRLADRVTLAGAIAAIHEEYERAQLFVLPSTYESFALAAAEALAHGLPVVGFAECPGTNELVLHDENGLLVRGEDRPQALASGLAELMGSTGTRERMALEAPPAVARFQLEHVVDRWEALAWAMISARHGKAPSNLDHSKGGRRG